MPSEITLPQLGLTMEKGTVVEWLAAVGDRITPGQEICQIETDKATMGVEARDAGTLARILVPEDQEVAVGTVLAVVVADGETLPADWQPGRPAAGGKPGSEPAVQAPQLVRESAPAKPVQVSWKARAMAREAGLDLRMIEGSGPGGRIIARDVASRLGPDQPSPGPAASPPARAEATPLATKLAATLGLDLAQVAGSGPKGRVTRADVLDVAAAIIRSRAQARPEPAPGPPQVAYTTPLKGVRKIVSEGMARSAHTTARVTLFREADATELVHLRERLKAGGVDVSYNDLLVGICGVVLREHPGVNARLGDGQVEHLDRVNIGLAVDTERGLLVPVIHDADRLRLPEIAAERARLVADARAGRSMPDDLHGGTFTLSNLGMLGVEGFTPIINLPESCILGVGRIVPKPVVVDEADTLAVRPMMILSLAFDHRVMDGAPAARFLHRVVQLVQNPALLLAVAG